MENIEKIGLYLVCILVKSGLYLVCNTDLFLLQTTVSSLDEVNAVIFAILLFIHVFFCLDVISMIAEAREATKKPAPASMKSRLQEYCQRSKKPLPAYQTDMRPDKTVISTVTVDGKSFTSDVSPSKKLAEHAAAEKALLDLDLLAKAS